MKLRLFIVMMCFKCLILSAQNIQRSTLGNSGNSTEITSSKKTYYISQSIGQNSIIGTFNNNNHTIRQGFQQAPIVVKIITESNNDLNAVVYPNPVNNYVTIKLNEELKIPLNIAIYDVLGKIIFLKSQDPKKSFDINLSFLASGTYLLNLTSENKRFSARLIKK